MNLMMTVRIFFFFDKSQQFLFGRVGYRRQIMSQINVIFFFFLAVSFYVEVILHGKFIFNDLLKIARGCWKILSSDQKGLDKKKDPGVCSVNIFFNIFFHFQKKSIGIFMFGCIYEISWVTWLMIIMFIKKLPLTITKRYVNLLMRPYQNGLHVTK